MLRESQGVVEEGRVGVAYLVESGPLGVRELDEVKSLVVVVRKEKGFEASYFLLIDPTGKRSS